MFYPFCHIVYLLSFEKIDFLIEKGIFTVIINLMDDPESAMISYVSDIIFNAVQFGLENNKILTLTNTPQFKYNRGTSKKETPTKIGIKEFSLATDY